jgi:hypothetical protein
MPQIVELDLAQTGPRETFVVALKMGRVAQMLANV